MGLALHLLMATYGWTISQALELTLPQMKMLMAAMADYPPPIAVVGELLRSGSKEQLGGLTGKLPGAKSKRGAEFWRAIGLPEPTETEENGG